jgi:hypothetical protein
MASPALTLEDFKQSPAGRIIAPILADARTIMRMESLSLKGRSAVRAVDELLPSTLELGRAERCHLGRWVRDVLVDHGWQTTDRRDDAGGWKVLTSGTVYARRRRAAIESDKTGVNDLRARIGRAQALVRTYSSNDYGLDDFIADKRAEAAREPDLNR